jgi:hypothetical protein
LLRLPIKEKHNNIKSLVKEVDDLKRMLDVVMNEVDHSSEEYARVLKSPKKRKERPSLFSDKSGSGTDDQKSQANLELVLGQFT